MTNDSPIRVEPNSEQAEAAVRVLKLLADATRLQLVYALLHGEHSVNELAAHLQAQPSAVSQHLAKLRLAGVVTARREGNRIFYATADQHLETLVAEAFLHAKPVTSPVVSSRRAVRG